MCTFFQYQIPRGYSCGAISSTSQIGGDNQPAQSFTRGNSALSSKRVLTPDLTRKEAQVLPAGPPPTIIASNVGIGFMTFFYNFLIITRAILSER
jgi:hypothetical protein